jgi:hypothetical protein
LKDFPISTAARRARRHLLALWRSMNGSMKYYAIVSAEYIFRGSNVTLGYLCKLQVVISSLVYFNVSGWLTSLQQENQT